MNAGGTVETHGLRVTMVPAAHSSGDLMGGDETCATSGSRSGFVIELENGFRIYDAGDTTVFGDMALIRELYAAGPRDPPDRRPLHDGPGRGGGRRRAARRPATCCPIHWGTFPILTGHAGGPGRGAGRPRVSRRPSYDWKPGDTSLAGHDRPAESFGAGTCGPACDLRSGAARGSAGADERVGGTPSRASAERPEGSRTRRPASQSWLTPGCMLWTITRSVSIELGSATDSIATPSGSWTAGISASV